MISTTTRELSLKVLLLEKEGCWVAQCLEPNLVAQAKTLGELLAEFERLVQGHLTAAREAGIEPFQNLPSAPRRYWDLWQSAQVEVGPRRSVALSMPEGTGVRPKLRYRAAA